MKSLELTNYGVEEMSAVDMNETDGGLVWFVVAGACLLLASCTGNNTNHGINTGTQVNVQNGQNTTTTKVDSSSIHVNGVPVKK